MHLPDWAPTIRPDPAGGVAGDGKPEAPGAGDVGWIGPAELRRLRTTGDGALLLPPPSNSSGLSPERQESLSRTPQTVMPMQRGTLTQAWVSPAYCEVDALVTSASVRATSTPRAAKLDSVVWKLLGRELPPVKWVCRPTQSIGTPRDLKSWIMR